MSRYKSLQDVTEDTLLFGERVIDRLRQFETILENVKTECNEKISVLKTVMEEKIKKQEKRFIGYNAQIAELKDDHIKLNEAVCASLSKGSKRSKSWHGLSCMTRSSVRRSRSNSSNTSSGGTRCRRRRN